MTEYILGGIIIVGIIGHGLYVWSVHKEINKLTKAVIAKNIGEYVTPEEIKREQPDLEVSSEVKLSDDLSDREFDNTIQAINKGLEEENE